MSILLYSTQILNIWFSLKRAASIMGEVKSIKYSLLALVQGNLEIPVEVNMHWEEKWALEILKTKTEEESYPLRGDR